MMLYSCTHMATVGMKRLMRSDHYHKTHRVICSAGPWSQISDGSSRVVVWCRSSPTWTPTLSAHFTDTIIAFCQRRWYYFQ